MKSITLSRFVLLVLASVVSSCEHPQIPKTGYLSSFQSRSIASVPSSIHKPQDFKQALIYCHVKSDKLRDCYHRLVKQLKGDPADFFEIKDELLQVTNAYRASITKEMTALIKKRREFCKSNTSYNFEKCLKMNIQKNTMALVNASHKKNRFTPHEYLYLRKHIKMWLEAALNERTLSKASQINISL